MQVINKSNKKEHHAKCGLHFLSDLISSIDSYLFNVFAFIWVESQKINMRHAHIYTRFKQGGSGGSFVCCRLAKPASNVCIKRTGSVWKY